MDFIQKSFFKGIWYNRPNDEYHSNVHSITHNELNEVIRADSTVVSENPQYNAVTPIARQTAWEEKTIHRNRTKIVVNKIKQSFLYETVEGTIGKLGSNTQTSNFTRKLPSVKLTVGILVVFIILLITLFILIGTNVISNSTAFIIMGSVLLGQEILKFILTSVKVTEKGY